MASDSMEKVGGLRAQDRSNSFMDINAGVSDTDSMDWVSMLARMYLRYCEAKGWRVEGCAMQDGDEAGFKTLTLRIEGEFAYGYLKAEVGVHRLVRISPFDANAPLKTAFASVDVYAEVDDSIPLDIPEEDIEFKFIRSGGHGGQRVNNHFYTAQLRHLPTGILITCDAERLPSANKDMAFRILRARLSALETKKREAERDSSSSEIRSYVLAPGRRVKDLRTGVETDNVDAVLKGELEPFITAWLKGVRLRGG